MSRRLLFSVTAKDFDMQMFCTGGNGGQHRNAKRNGVRIIHRASGARGEHRDGRDQHRNREAAFKKLLNDPRWIAWHKLEIARHVGMLDAANAAVDATLTPSNLRTEVRGEDGLWEGAGDRFGEHLEWCDGCPLCQEVKP